MTLDVTKKRGPRSASRSAGSPSAAAPPAAARRSARRVTAAGLALAGLLAAAGCSGSQPADAPAAGAVTAVPVAVSPSPSLPPGVSGSLSPGPSGSPSVGFSGTPSAGASGSVVPLTPDVVARLDAAIERVRTQAAVPGVIVGLTTPGGSYQKAFGVADKVAGTPMSTGLNMRIGSETKTFTVTGLLRLVDQGRLGLDDPVSKYVQDVPNGGNITLRQLADMRSGLFPYTSDQVFVQTFLANPQQVFTPRQLLGYGFKHPANFAPGAAFEYSNTNTVLLGVVIEKVSGQPLDVFLKQQVMDPAGLGRTVFPTDAAFPEPHARGYTDQTPDGTVADATDWNPSWAWAAGAMISDLPDLQTWAKVVATGTLLKPATQAQRLAAPSTGVPGTAYGLGIFEDHGWIGHNGSLPGYQSLVLYLPFAQASLVVLLNTDISSAGQAPSTLFGQAITEIVSPQNVFTLPAEEDSGGSASASASGSASGAGSSA